MTAANDARSGDRAFAQFDMVPATLLSGVPQLVRQLGGNPAALMESVGINPLAAQHPGENVAFNAFASLLSLGAERLGVGDFGLRLARQQLAGQALGPIGVLMRNAATANEAMRYCAQYGHACCPPAKIRLDRGAGGLAMALDLLPEEPVDTRQAMEHMLLHIHLKLGEITDGAVAPRRVALQHDALSPTASYVRYFGCDVACVQEESALIYSDRGLDRDIVGADPQILEMAMAFIEQRFPPRLPSIQARVRLIVFGHLGTRHCSYEAVAERLHMHPRTLQRRLRNAGRSFEAIKDDVRRELAWRNLRETELPLAHIAGKLGYADASVLSRSCLRWFRASPLQVRQNYSRRAA